MAKTRRPSSAPSGFAAIEHDDEVPMVSLTAPDFMGDDTALAVDIPYGFARDHGVVLLKKGDGRLVVALREGADPMSLLEVRRHLAMPFDVEMAGKEQFERHLSDHYAVEGSAAAMASSLNIDGNDLELLASDLPTADDLLDSADDAPAIRLINGIIAEAARQGVSDIHIEPSESSLKVRLRIDGLLYETMNPPRRMLAAITSRIKILASLDIAERRLPQDGRASIRIGDGDVV